MRSKQTRQWQSVGRTSGIKQGCSLCLCLFNTFINNVIDCFSGIAVAVTHNVAGPSGETIKIFNDKNNKILKSGTE
jgi:hypothetical protein